MSEEPGGAAPTRDALTAEVERLRGLLAGSQIAEGLREALLGSASAAVIAAPIPHEEVLSLVVETAVAVLSCDAGALFLLDEPHHELVFQTAVGGRAERVKQFRVALGHGIAGYVAATGQPIAIADAQHDPRFAREIGEAVDYHPSTILCVPLYLHDRVIGVLELLNKIGGPFTTGDMELLGRFGRLAAFAIDQARLHQDLRHLFRSLLRDALGNASSAAPAQRFADLAATDMEHADAVKLAGMVHELNRRGEDARRLAGDVLGAVTRYVKARERPA